MTKGFYCANISSCRSCSLLARDGCFSKDISLIQALFQGQIGFFCRSGGIGRRARFRFLWVKACGGSSPPFGTKFNLAGIPAKLNLVRWWDSHRGRTAAKPQRLSASRSEDEGAGCARKRRRGAAMTSQGWRGMEAERTFESPKAAIYLIFTVTPLFPFTSQWSLPKRNPALRPSK